MNRRHFIKSLVAVPIAAVVAAKIPTSYIHQPDCLRYAYTEIPQRTLYARIKITGPIMNEKRSVFAEALLQELKAVNKDILAAYDQLHS